MKIKFLSILLIVSFYLKAQTNFTIDIAPIIENYSYGELDLKVIPFGMGNEINMGKILADGTLQFNWPVLDSTNVNNGSMFMQSIKSALVDFNTYCEDSQIEENTEDCKVVNTQFIYVYRDKQQVGVLLPATDKALLKNEPANIYSDLTLGSSISWYYSTGACNFIAKCTEQKEWEGKYNFTKENNYNVHLKKGWNIVQYTLSETEKFKDENGMGNMEKKVVLKSIESIPQNIKWHLKTFVKID